MGWLVVGVEDPSSLWRNDFLTDEVLAVVIDFGRWTAILETPKLYTVWHPLSRDNLSIIFEISTVPWAESVVTV